jgi:hypothetical protein
LKINKPCAILIKLHKSHAGVVKLADTQDLGSCERS